jgi:hypothetical protein
MRKKSEYNVYPHSYPFAMSEEEDTLTETAGESREEEQKEAQTIQLEGYTTVFDIKVSLTPVELIPVGDRKI